MSSDLHKTKTGKCVPQKLRRNERERKRVHQVNLGFERLRDRVPAPGPNKKWSKADTLREAVKYIRFLREQLLAEEEAMLNQTTSFHKTERDFSGEFYQEIRPFHPQEMNASFPATRCSLNSPESGYGSTLSPEVFSRQQHPQCPSHSSSF